MAASSFTLLGPILGAVLGACGATAAAVIGAFITARLNQANILAGRHIGDAENQRDMDSINRPNLQDPSSVAAADGVQTSRLQPRSI
ncbi:hypothetical protein HD806DRAFT_541534 [Xylariaceae sp. AK1471]|nr:hypothetical protein HD806DRAFT_541534 [Xylariaceae sp. AK1471]